MAGSSSDTQQLVIPCSTRSTFDEHMKEKDKLVVFEFAASWCGYCQLIEPAVKELAEKNSDVKFVKIDWDEMREVTREHRVRGFPTFILVKKGKPVTRIVGAKKDELDRQIQKYKG